MKKQCIQCGCYLLFCLSLYLMQVCCSMHSMLKSMFRLAMGCTYTNAQAVAEVKSVGIDIHSSGGCSNRNNPACTSLEQVRCNTITCIKILKTSSGCSLTITGGTVRKVISLISRLCLILLGNWSCKWDILTLDRI